jgi:F-type H+-transporting ATPase subunit b
MDATLHALGGLLLRAVPTFVLVLLLDFYLRVFFFKPFEKTLQERYDATEGARKLAEEALERAAARTAEYEAAMRAARAEVYEAQERFHEELQERRAAQIQTARERADAAVQKAKAEVANEVEAAKSTLGVQADDLADRIIRSILRSAA